MSEGQVVAPDPCEQLAARLAEPPAELTARARLLDDALEQLQAALTTLDGV